MRSNMILNKHQIVRQHQLMRRGLGSAHKKNGGAMMTSRPRQSTSEHIRPLRFKM
jgi:hypothetical protein